MVVNLQKFFTIFQDEIFNKILITAVIGLLLYIIDNLIIKNLIRKLQPAERRFQFKKIIRYTIFLIFIFFLWFGDSRSSFATFLGLISAGLAIAIKDPITSFIAWLTILFSRNYYLEGDRIEVDGLKGDVIEITPMYTSIMEIGNWVDADQSTGRIVQLPNHKIFTSEVYNYNRNFPYIWEEMNILITFESDYKQGKTVIESIANDLLSKSSQAAENLFKENAEKSTLIKYKNFNPIVYTEIKDSGVELSLRYLVETRKRRNYRMLLSNAILDEFALNPKLELAYPTIRVFKHGE